MLVTHSGPPTSPDMTSLYVESKNFTFRLPHNVAIRLPSGDHAAARLGILVLRTLRIERSNQSRPGNIPDPYSQVGGHHELLPIRRPRQEVHRAVHVGLLLEDRALPGLADVPKNHRGFPAAATAKRVPSGDQARLDTWLVEEDVGPMTRVPFATFQMRTTPFAHPTATYALSGDQVSAVRSSSGFTKAIRSFPVAGSRKRMTPSWPPAAYNLSSGLS